MDGYKPRYIYEDGEVFDRENRMLQVGSLVVDIETDKIIATSYLYGVGSCGYPGCRSFGDHEQKIFDNSSDADDWFTSLNERKSTP